MDELLSVIIPIYNVQSYLKRCVDSVINQTHQNLEIILVDDGSPDRCGQICDDYEKTDSRIKVIHKKNGGLSDARNAGLEVATGEWISFIDSDDWIEPTMYTELLDNAHKYGAEISVGGVNDEIYGNGTTQIVKSTFNGKKEVECLEPVEAMRKHLVGSWAAWDKIYRRELFEGIRFPVGEINEDELIMLLLLERCSKIVYTNEVYYHYIRRAYSITTSSFSAAKLAWPRHCEDNLTWVKVHYPTLENVARQRYLNSLLWAMREMALGNGKFNVERRYVKKKLDEYYSDFVKLPLTKKETIRLYLHHRFPFIVYRAVEKLLTIRK